MRAASSHGPLRRTLPSFGLLTALLVPLSLSASPGCGDPDLGSRPATCPDGACPEGYDCVHGICTSSDEIPPLLVARVGNFRGEDLLMLPQSDGALIVWQTYAYSDEGEAFFARRLRPDGSASEAMTLVSSFIADPGALEPFYDVIALSDTRLLLAVAASPVDESPEPRLITYRVDLPPPGQEGNGTQFQAAWSGEERMPTIGYGAVSAPRFSLDESGIQLGYVLTRTDEDEMAMTQQTVAELAIFRVDENGARTEPPACEEPPCCPADTCLAARAGLPVAVGVVDAFAVGAETWWVLDDVRPSALLSSAANPVEIALEGLSIPVRASGESLSYLRPSARTGALLETDPVTGNAALAQLALGDQSISTLAEIPTLRDHPRPVWLEREDGSALLVGVGTSVNAENIDVYRVDPGAGAVDRVMQIPRLASNELTALGAVRSAGRLYVAWAEDLGGNVAIRSRAVAEP